MYRIADNLNAMNPVVARALETRDPAPLRGLVRRLVAAGVDLIDVNPGHLSRHRQDGMAFLVEAVQAETDLPLVLDSPQPEVLAAAIPACRRPPLLDALTAEPHRIEAVLPLAERHGLDLVLLLVDERSAVPDSLEAKVALTLQLVRAAADAGVPAERLVVDPVLPSLAWPDAETQLEAAVELVRLLSGGALLDASLRTMAGLSNLRSGLGGQIPVAVEHAALRRLAAAGLTHALLNPLRHDPTNGSR